MHPHRHLITFGELYPEAWKAYDRFRGMRGQAGIVDWPDWCYCPLAASYAVVSGGGALPYERSHHVGILGALAAWRVGKGVYEFHPTLERELWETPVTGDLPSELLLHLPEWCPYVLLQDPRGGLLGFWVQLEYDANDLHTELRFVLDADEDLIPVPLRIDGSVSVEQALQRVIDYGAWQAKRHGLEVQAEGVRQISDWLGPCMSLVLYLCQRNLDLRPGNAAAAKAGKPANPAPTKTRKGLRTFGPSSPLRWEAGWRIGPALEAARNREGAAGEEEHAGPRAHIRRAHWHTYRVGQGRQRAELRWLHPILVGAPEDGVPTVRRINACKD